MDDVALLLMWGKGVVMRIVGFGEVEMDIVGWS